MSEGLLLVVIIILLAVIVMRNSPGSAATAPRYVGNIRPALGCPQQAPVGCPKQAPISNCVKIEKLAQAENAEYFVNCGSDSPAPAPTNCTDDNYAYAINDFGAPGVDYKEWIASQSIDPQVIKNHAEFVADQQNKGTTVGRTYSPDSNDSYNPISWQGLRRPQAVPVCNPTQVPDIDISLYSTKPSFTWTSSE